MTQAGIVPRVLQSWRSPGKVVTSLRGAPDRVLIAILMLAMLMILVARAPVYARAAIEDPSIPFDARMGGALLAIMFILPLIAYGLAALVSALSRLTRWRVSPLDSRLALFWALLAASPAILLAGMTEGLVDPGPSLKAVQYLAGISILVIWGAGLKAVAEKA